MRSFEQSLVRNGFKVHRKCSRLLGWCHNHLRVEVVGIWCLLITCKKPGSGSFIRSRTVAIQYQRFPGSIAPSEVIFLLQVIQLGDNSEKLLGFGALHFHLLAKKSYKIGVIRPLPPIHDPSPSRRVVARARGWATSRFETRFQGY